MVGANGSNGTSATGQTCGIAIMAKASAPGRTKTRLVPPLTFDEAAAINTAFLQDIAGNVLLAGQHAGIAGYAAFAPRGSEDFFSRILPPAIGLIDACLPNFGDCLLRTVEEILERGHGSAVVLNSDSSPGGDGRSVSAGGRPRRARSVERRRILFVGTENRTSAHVRGHRLEH